ncbi:hypothetical protein C8Q73DRAFT_709950 [Cubamyces lactineus]|nr:hypothetical protein C8Q73DRAFT_709950 [Cubamyces lactineus]
MMYEIIQGLELYLLSKFAHLRRDTQPGPTRGYESEVRVCRSTPAEETPELRVAPASPRRSTPTSRTHNTYKTPGSPHEGIPTATSASSQVSRGPTAVRVLPASSAQRNICRL